MKTTTIITAGGTSSRFGNRNKLLEKINGKEVIKYTVEAFEKADVDEIIICANKAIIPDLSNMFVHKIIEGGISRQASVYNGLKAAKKCDYVLIHDGARPVITPEIINRTIDLVKEKNAVRYFMIFSLSAHYFNKNQTRYTTSRKFSEYPCPT